MKIYFGRYPKDDNKKRKMEIRVDDYDVWGAHDTLSLIITPVLKKLKEKKHGAPYVDDADVPEHLRDEHLPKENEWDTGIHHFEKWDWVLDEMIWAFEQDTMDWEDQFHSGEIDLQFIEIPNTNFDGTGNMSQMIRGPNDTHVYDSEGSKAWSKRMENGRILFAKYYFSLWD